MRWLEAVFSRLGLAFLVALGGAALAQSVAPVAILGDEVDLVRLGMAALTGTIVQALTLLVNQRGFARLETARGKNKKWQARLTNIAEALLAGIAAATVVGLMRGAANIEWGYAGEFAVAAFAGSVGSEYIFGLLEKRANKAASALEKIILGGDKDD